MTSETIVRWLEGFGQLDIGAAAVLAALFIVAAFVPMPRTFLVLGAGAAFGLPAQAPRWASFLIDHSDYSCHFQ